jgi:hypothetical protein
MEEEKENHYYFLALVDVEASSMSLPLWIGEKVQP